MNRDETLWALHKISGIPVERLQPAYDAGYRAAREDAAKLAAKYKASVDASVDCSDGRRMQIINFDGHDIAARIRKLEPSNLASEQKAAKEG